MANKPETPHSPADPNPGAPEDASQRKPLPAGSPEVEDADTPYPTQAQINRVKRGLPADHVEGREMAAGDPGYANRQMRRTD